METTPAGCDTTADFLVEIQPVPSSVIIGSSTACEYETASLYSTLFHPGSTYAWTVSGGTISSGVGTSIITVDWGIAGIGSVSVMETNAEGCDTTVSIPVTIHPKTDPDISGPITVCEFTGTHVYSTPNIPGNTYIWVVAGGNITAGSGTNSITVEWAEAGAGTVEVSEFSPLGCDTTELLAITITSKPDPEIAGPLEVCEFTGGDIFTTPVFPGNTYSWTVSGGSIVAGAGTNSITVDWGTAGPGSVSVTETNADGCDTTETHALTIHPKPDPDITGPDPVCAFTDGNLYTTPSIIGNTYLWSIVGGDITSGNGTPNISVQWHGAGTGTLTLTETSLAGCDTTESFSVNIDPNPTPVISGRDTVCEFDLGEAYSVVDVPGSTYAWAISGGSITSGAGTNAITVDWNSAGLGTLNLTQTSSTGCDSSIAVNIIIHPRPNPVITGISPVCEFTGGHVYSIPSVGGESYAWSVTGGTIESGAGTNSIAVYWGNAGAGTVDLIVSNTFGCDTAVSFPVTIDAKPDPIITGAGAVCAFTLGEVYSTPNIPGNTYTWTISGGLITAGAGTNSITVDWASAGIGILTLIETNALGCDTTEADTIEINSRPDPEIAGPGTVCELSGPFTYSTPPVAGATYTWTVAGGTVITGAGTNSIAVHWSAAGIGNISLTQSNGIGCDTTEAIGITINEKPDPDIVGPATACEFSTGHVYTTPGTPGSSFDWTVTGGDITAGTGTNTITVSWNGSSVGSVAVNETNALGCDSTESISVTIDPNPNTLISGPDSICAFTGGHAYTTTGSPGNTYSWTITGGTIATGVGTNSISVDWDAAGPGFLFLTETNGLGCDTSVTYPVHISPNPIPNIIGASSLCEYSSGINYSTADIPGSTYLWTVSGGTIAAGAGTASIVVNWGTAGAGTVTVQETASSGCDTIVNYAVVLEAIPDPDILGPLLVCSGDIGNVYTTPAIAVHSYNWIVSNGSITAGIGTNSVTVEWDTAGIGTLSLTQIAPSGCDTTESITVTISANPVPVISGMDTLCEFTNGLSYSTPNVPGASWLWNVIGGTISSGAGTNIISVDWGASGTGSISLTETDGSGCDANVMLPITIHPKPAPIISGPDPVCAWSGGHIYSTPFVAGSAYSWSISGGTISAGGAINTIVVDWNGSGTGTLTVTETNSFGCDSLIDLSVSIIPNPSPLIAGPDPVCEYTSGHAYSTPIVPGNSFDWTIAGGLITSGVATNSVTVDWGIAGIGVLNVTETDPSGCDTTVSLAITKDPKPDPDIVGINEACEFTSGLVYSSPEIPGNTYAWSVTGGSITAGIGTGNITVDWGSAGIGTLTLIETSAIGCDTSETFSVTLHPKPDPDITGALTLCEYTDGNVYSTPLIPGNSYVWSITNGEIVGGAGSNSVTVFWYAGPIGSLSVMESNGLGCDTTETISVTLEAKPDPVLTGPLTVCEFTSGHVYSTPTVAGHSYLWSVSGGTISSGAGTNAITVDWGMLGAGTVTLLQTSPAGCDTTESIAILIDTRPEPVITGTVSVCAWTDGFIYTTATPGPSYVWAVTGGNIISGAGTDSIMVQWDAAGPGMINLTESNGAGCDTTVDLAITIFANPSPTVSGAIMVCAWDTGAVYSVPMTIGDSYDWEVTGGVISSPDGLNSISVQWNAAGPGEVSLMVTNAAGCDTTLLLPVTINANPSPMITGADTVCAWTDGIAYSTLNVPGNTYAWTISGGTIATGTGTNAITVDWEAAGIGILSVTETNSAGCDSVANFSILLPANPSPIVSGPDPVCAWSNDHVYSTPAIAGSSYGWTITGGSITSGTTSNSIAVDWEGAGIGTLDVTATNLLGCDTTVTASISITPNPVSSISGPDTVCEYTPGHAYSTANVPGNTYDWVVVGGNITAGAGSNSILVDWDHFGIGNVSMTETDPVGCDTTVSLDVVIQAKPDPIISGPVNTCENVDGYVYATTMISGSSWNWTVTGGTITAGVGTNAITVQWDLPGAGNISVQETNAAGCDTTVNLAVVVNPRPIPTITGPSPICAYTTGNIYSVLPTPGNTWIWDITGGVIIAGASTNSITVTWDGSGLGTLSVLETNVNGCSTPDTLMITIDPVPVPVITGPDTVCQFEFGVTYTTPVVAGDGYSWSATGGTIISGAGTNSVTVDWGIAGSGSLTLTQTDPSGCDSTLILPITIRPRPIPVITGSTLLCAFSEGANYAVTPSLGNTYVWSAIGGTIIGDATQPSVTINWGTVGPASVQIIQTNEFGCDTTEILPITLSPNTPPAIIGPDDICEFETGAVYSTPVLAGAAFNWSVSGGIIVSGAGTNSIAVDWSSTGLGYVSVEQISAVGCVSLDTLPILLNPRPIPEAMNNGPICEGTEAILFSNSFPGATYEWFDAGGLLISTDTVDTISGLTPGSYDYSLVITVNGCVSDTDLTTVTMLSTPPALVIPADTAICEGSGIAFGTASVAEAFTWTGPAGYSSSLPFPPAISPVNPTHEGWYVASGIVGGCPTEADSFYLSILPKPLPANIQSNSPLCYGDPLMLWSDSVCTSYKWIGPDGDSDSTLGLAPGGLRWTLNDTTIILSSDSTEYDAGNWSVICVSPDGCESDLSAPINVVIYPHPDAPDANSNSNICEGEDLLLFATNIPGATYEWVGPAGYTSTDQNPIIPGAVLADSGMYGVIAIVDGCPSDTAFTFVTIHPIPAAPAPTSSAPICEGDTLFLFAGVAGVDAYLWSGPNEFDASIADPLVAEALPLDSGDYVLRVVVNGCVSPPGTVFAPVIPRPTTPTVTGALALCEGDSSWLNADTYTGGTVLYHWNTPSGPLTTGTPELIFDPVAFADSGIYSLTVEVDGCLSQESWEDTLVVNTIPASPIMLIDNVLCEGDTLTLNTPSVADSIFWMGPDSFFSGVASPGVIIVTPANAGEYQLWIQENGCLSAVVSDSVFVNSRPLTPDIAYTGPLCFGDSIHLSTTSDCGSYQWIGPDGASDSTLGPIGSIRWTTTNSTSIGVSDVEEYDAGLWSVICIDSLGCSSFPSAELNVEITSIPNPPAATSNSEICVGARLELYASGDTGVVYNWIGPGGFTSSDQNPTIPVAALADSGIYTVSTSMNGCPSDSATTFVTINAPLPAPSPIALSPVCEGDSLFFFAGISGIEYAWSGPEAFVSFIEDPFIYPALPGYSGTYELIVIENGCPSLPGLVTVEVTPLPELFPNAGNDTLICDGNDPIFLTAESSEFEGFWSTSSGLTILTPDSISTAVTGLSVGGSWHVVWTLISDGVCEVEASDSIRIQVANYPVAVNDFAGLLQDEFVNNVFAAENDTIFEVPLEGTVALIGQPPHGFAEVNPDYSVNYEPEAGYHGTDSVQYMYCRADCPDMCDTAWIYFIIEPDIFVPDLITPNGDDINDSFEILGLDRYPQNELYIYNRWGNLIFETVDYANDWYGTHKGAPAPDGTYYYIFLDRISGREIATGYITIHK